MSDNEMLKLAQALHEASVYGIGATSDVNQRVILEAAKAFAAAASAEPVAIIAPHDIELDQEALRPGAVVAIHAPDAEIVAALEGLVNVIDAAGLINLSNGVQLGPTVWYVKASERLDYAREQIAKAKGGSRI